MLQEYEITIIIDAHLSSEGIESVIQNYSSIVEKDEGKIHMIDRWGKRRLVYEIAKKQYGFYVYIRFAANGSIIQEIERLMKLDDQVLRFLTIRLPKIALKQEKLAKKEASPAQSKEASPAQSKEASSAQSTESNTDANSKEDKIDSDEPSVKTDEHVKDTE